jgi:hypothetical protein
MVSKATEDTITTLLKEELEKLGVKAEAFPLITTPQVLGNLIFFVVTLVRIRLRRNLARGI